MITRAQAEALLTLAESLEACDRLGIELGGYSANGSAVVDVDISHGGFESVIKGQDIRTFVRLRLPK